MIQEISLIESKNRVKVINIEYEKRRKEVEVINIECEERRKEEEVINIECEGRRKEVEIINIECEEGRNEVSISAELCMNPWSYYDKIQTKDIQMLTENDKTFYGPAFNSVIRDIFQDKAKQENYNNDREISIVGYKFRSTPTVTFGGCHFIQEEDKLFFGPFYGPYQRQRVVWKAKKSNKIRRK